MLNVCLVGDNRSSWNWGGRAAGIALHGLLERRFRVASTTTGLEAAGPQLHLGTLAPPRLFRAAWDRRASEPFRSWIRLEQLWGAHDYVCPEPEDTAEAILRGRNRFPLLRSLHDRIAASDVVVLNGEGDLVLTTPPRRTALMILGLGALAARLGKRVVLANAMISDCPWTGRNLQTLDALARLLRGCDAVFVRDERSRAYLRQAVGDVDAAMIPDALFAWHAFAGTAADDLPRHGDCAVPFGEEAEWARGKLDFRRPYVCVGGGAAAALHPRRAEASYIALVKALKTLGLPVILTENDGSDGFLRGVANAADAALLPAGTPIYLAAAVLANARLFVSGRYHPAIMAMLGGAPCVFLDTTAHKTDSLQHLIGLENPRTFPAMPEAPDIDAILACARDHLDAGETMRQRLRAATGVHADAVAELPDRIASALSSRSTATRAIAEACKAS